MGNNSAITNPRPSAIPTANDFVSASAGSGDAGKGAELNVDGKIDPSMIPRNGKQTIILGTLASVVVTPNTWAIPAPAWTLTAPVNGYYRIDCMGLWEVSLDNPSPPDGFALSHIMVSKSSTPGIGPELGSQPLSNHSSNISGAGVPQELSAQGFRFSESDVLLSAGDIIRVHARVIQWSVYGGSPVINAARFRGDVVGCKLELQLQNEVI